MKAREVVVTAFLAALLYVQQVSLSALPNIHLCAFLIILYTLHFPRLVLPATIIFILLEGVTFGFGMWWFSYLYIWPLLIFIVWLFRKNRSVLFWAVVAGTFGLCYGALCSFPYFFLGGPSTMLAYWIQGIPFDILHCVGNVFVTLLLWKPISFVFGKLDRFMKAS